MEGAGDLAAQHQSCFGYIDVSSLPGPGSPGVWERATVASNDDTPYRVAPTTPNARAEPSRSS